MSREKELVKNTFIIAFGTFLPKLSSIITLPIITAGLTKAEYGTYDLISTLVSLFLPVVTLQIQTAAFRYLIDCRGDKEKTSGVISNIVAFVIPMSVLSLLILYFALFKLSGVLRLLICAYFFVDILIITFQQIVRGLANNKLYSASSVIQSLINMLLIVGTVYLFKQGLTGVLLSIIIATFVGAVVLFLRGRILEYIKLSYVSKATLKELIGYSWPMIPNSLSGWVLAFSDRLVLTTFLGLEANAIYAVANKIPSLFTTVQSTFVCAWQENASLASKDDDAEAYYTSMFDNIFCIMVGIMALLIAATPVLFALLIQGDYDEAYYQMPLLFMALLFSTLSSFLGGIYVAHKHTKSVGITTVMAAVCNLVIDLVAVKLIGMYAASLSTLISYFILVLYRMKDVQKFQKINYKKVKICIYILSLTAMCGICYVNNLYFNIFNFVLGVVLAFVSNRQTLKVFMKAFTSKIKH